MRAQVIKYLESIGTNRQTDEWAVTTIARLKPFNLTTTELIQVLNHMPTEVLEFHVVCADEIRSSRAYGAVVPASKGTPNSCDESHDDGDVVA